MMEGFPWIADSVDDLTREHAKRKAEFCLATGVQPSEYDRLTQIEINAFISQANKNAKRK